MNKAILWGHLGKDPELRETQNSKVANFSLATTETYKDKSGERKSVTEWHNVVVWGNMADVIAKYVKKGDPILVEGKIKSRSWDDKDGNKHYITEVVVDISGSIKLMPRATKEERVEAKPNEKPIDASDVEVEDDLPF